MSNAAPTTGRGVILAVDDNPANLKLLTTILGAEGYRVQTAENGELALESVAVSPPELILLDIRMPGLDGFEVCRLLKARTETRDIPILFISAVADKYERVEGFGLGAVDFLATPLRREELLARVGTHLELSRTRARLARQADDLRRANEQLQREMAEREKAGTALSEANRELKASRLSALNMMEDAIESRKEVENANRELQDDIAERRRVEEALRESEERFRMLAESSLAGIYFFHDGRFDYVNPALAAIFGYPVDEIVGRLGPQDLTHPGDHALLAENIRRRMEDGIPDIRYEFRGLRKDGGVIDIEVHGGRIEYRGHPAILGTLLDITGRRRAEERLREQAALLDAANDAIYVSAIDGTVTYWNEGAERLYGWKREEAPGRNIAGLEGLDGDAFKAACAAVIAQGNWSGELRRTGRAGRQNVVFCRWTLLRDQQGRPREILAINTDVTEKKQLEANFLRVQRLESIGALAGGIAHDLNNLLTPIVMGAPFLREAVHDAESREMLATVEACAQRGADIIRQLLTFARGRPGARLPVPLKHLVDEVRRIACETFPRNIRVKVSSHDDLWPVLGDATQIHQALMNLCVNARDAMNDGGTLTLAAANTTIDETFAAAVPEARPGPHVCVSVADTGVGIPPENMDRIFDPFFTTKDVGKGTGLGLATVLGIVRGHGGFVRAGSRVGSGTVIEIYLPASPAAPAAPAVERAMPRRGAGELILVADDEATMRTVLRNVLEKHGYRVAAASEGAEALEIFAQRRDEVRAVLTDMMMPGMDGVELVHALRRLGAGVPILGMTGLGERSGVKGLETLGLPVMLLKPFAGIDLLAAIEDALAARRAAHAGPADDAGAARA